jgi:hypothetical protein
MKKFSVKFLRKKAVVHLCYVSLGLLESASAVAQDATAGAPIEVA